MKPEPISSPSTTPMGKLLAFPAERPMFAWHDHRPSLGEMVLNGLLVAVAIFLPWGALIAVAAWIWKVVLH